VLHYVLVLIDRLVVSAPIFGTGQNPGGILGFVAGAIPEGRAWGISTAVFGLLFPEMTGRTGLYLAHVYLLRVDLLVGPSSSCY
jgi:hypothetical protein